MKFSPATIICRYLLALPLLMALAPMLLNGQQLDSRTTGRIYILAYPDTTINTIDTRYPNKMEDKVFAYIYSAVDNNKITITGSGYNRVLTANAGKFAVLELTDPTFKAPQPIITESGKPSRSVFRVEAQQPVIIYCYMVTRFGTEAWTPIPVESWGTEYYAQAIPGEAVQDISPAGENNYNAVRKMAPAEILVIAAQDNTVITFTANGQFYGNPQLTSVKLNKNEAYQIQSLVDTSAGASRATQPDIAGTYITANKPIGVISGNTRAIVYDDVVGLGKNAFHDMTMEWLSPVDQHGTEFVYMPTMDARRATGAVGENLSEKRTTENVRVYATDQSASKTSGYRTDATGNQVDFEINGSRKFEEVRISTGQAAYFHTDSVAQAFMTCTAVVKFLGTTGSGNYIGSKYDGWGTYAVEMVPREQWINAAPYIAPIHPSQVDHKLNIVTDTASAKKIYWGLAGKAPVSQVLLNKPIAGTDLVWGDLSVAAGQDLWIMGWNPTSKTQDTSVRFYGFAYGLFKGHEEYRPGKTERKDDDGDEIASAGKDEVLHPSEYEEYLAVAYGYPLAPSRSLLRPGDSLRIDSARSCLTTTFTLTALNENPAGLRSISLEAVNNAKIVLINPASDADIVAKPAATFQVVPINPLKSASAIVVIRDRTNKEWRIPYTFEAEFVDVIPSNPAELNFGQIPLNQDSPIREITVANPLNRDVTIEKISWVDGKQQFRILEPSVPPAITLKPDESIKIKIQIKPTIDNRRYEDSLKIKLSCIEVSVKVVAEVVTPCIYMDDIDFGTVRPDSTVTKVLRICNTGQGYISFSNPSGLDVITWLDENFIVNGADKYQLANTVLGPAGSTDPDAPPCVTINVTFRASHDGYYSTVARVWASTRNCRDTSAWFANVVTPLGVESGGEAGTSLTRIDPNPSYGTTRIEFSLAHAMQANVEIFDVAGQRIATLADGMMQQGHYTVTWNTTGVPAGVYYCRLTADAATTTRTIVVVR